MLEPCTVGYDGRHSSIGTTLPRAVLKMGLGRQEQLLSTLKD